MVRAGSVVVFACIACGASTERPACAPEALAAIEAAYVAEAIAACQGETEETCEALPAIREKYRAKREAWRTCR